jgi:capsid protein
MPQARSGGSRSTSRSRSTSGAKKTSAAKSTSGAKSSSGRSQAKRSTATASSSRAKSTRSSGSRSARAKTAPRSTAKKASASAADARADAAAQRVRKLNERIISAGKEAGESTLSSYESALKAIASAIEKGPGSSEIDWISNVATAQAKFIRDVTTAWTNAARQRLK